MPRLTSIASGPYLKSLMSTLSADAAVGAPPDEEPPDDSSSEPQPATASRARTASVAGVRMP